MKHAVLLLGLAGSLSGVSPAMAQSPAATIVRHPSPVASAPILVSVTIPAGAETLYLSGQVPSPITQPAPGSAPPDTREAYGDTKTQAISIFHKIGKALAEQGYTLSDVVKLTVYLVSDPALGGKQDFKGFSEAYAQFFGTPAQPNKVARSTVQVAALANPGFLIEIEATAARVAR